jgi:isopenicillin N synthase-like dioxygenase
MDLSSLNETKKNSTELREMWDAWGPAGHRREGYPFEIPGLFEAFQDISSDLENTSKKLLKVIAVYLSMDDEDFFVKRHRNLGDHSIRSQTQIRSMWYDSLDKTTMDEIPPNAIRCGEHTDWGSITLLLQDMTGGLEVCLHKIC